MRHTPEEASIASLYLARLFFGRTKREYSGSDPHDPHARVVALQLASSKADVMETRQEIKSHDAE